MSVPDNTHLMWDHFADYSKEELVAIACNLYDDCNRLRRELDDAIGVIR